MAGENLDLSVGQTRFEDTSGSNGSARRFLGIQFACCGVYARVYVNREGAAYEGRCPRCGKPVNVRIGPGGTDSRFFTAY